MQLRIVDTSQDRLSRGDIRVELYDDGHVQSYYCRKNSIVFTKAWRERYDGYFREHYLQEPDSQHRQTVVERTIHLGGLLGDVLLGENFELFALIDRIKERGYPSVQVSIISDNTAFFDELWEGMILHETNYVLSTVVQGFVRQFHRSDRESIQLGLGTTAEAVTSAEREGQDDLPEKLTAKKSNLRVQYILGRDSLDTSDFGISNVFELVATLNSRSSVIDFDVANPLELDECAQSAGGHPHIVHYDGPIHIKNDAVFVTTTHAETASWVSLADLLPHWVDNGVHALFVQATHCTKDGNALNALEALTRIAKMAQHAGLHNVVGLSAVADPFVATQCFTAVYKQLCSGHELQQAVVEARKSLQHHLQCNLFAQKSVDFHRWPLLTHFSTQRVHFFAQTQLPTEEAPIAEIPLLSRTLYGFHADMLPPRVQLAGDGGTLRLFKQLLTTQVVNVDGEIGIGKTQLIHNAAALMALTRKIDFGFNFDLGREKYSERDIWQMIAPVQDLSPDDWPRVSDTLLTKRCLFVFDGYSESEENREYRDLVEKLQKQGHRVALIAKTPAIVDGKVGVLVRVARLSGIEQRRLTAQIVREEQDRASLNDSSYALWLASCSGHPWLLRKAMPVFTDNTNSSDWIQHDWQNCPDVVEQFYLWQWRKLSTAHQKYLLLMSESPVLLWETITIAAVKADSKLADNFSALLGCESKSLWSLQKDCERAGFLQRLTYGHQLESKCLSFLSTRKVADDWEEHICVLRLPFSRLVLEGIRITAQNIVGRPNAAVQRYLVMHAQTWFSHLDALWVNADFERFFKVRAAFNNLLTQMQAFSEIRNWSLDLLGKHSLQFPLNSDQKNAQIAWLSLALETLSISVGETNAVLKDAVQSWHHWIDSFNDESDKYDSPLYSRAVYFIEMYYWLERDWRNCLLVANRSANEYMSAGQWERALVSLNRVAKCQLVLGDKEAANLTEALILDQVPYEQLPPEIGARQTISVLINRLERSEKEQAMALINRVRSREDGNKYESILSSIEQKFSGVLN